MGKRGRGQREGGGAGGGGLSFSLATPVITGVWFPVYAISEAKKNIKPN